MLTGNVGAGEECKCGLRSTNTKFLGQCSDVVRFAPMGRYPVVNLLRCVMLLAVVHSAQG